jgi:hypothetical protein
LIQISKSNLHPAILTYSHRWNSSLLLLNTRDSLLLLKLVHICCIAFILCARARRILAIRWPKMGFLFYFAHQIQLLVKDVIKTNFTDIAQEAYAVIKTFNRSSSKWLPRLRELMAKVYGTQLALLLMAETRWNSMQGMFASLLRCRTAICMFYFQWNAADDFPDALLVLNPSGSFWEKVWSDCTSWSSLFLRYFIAGGKR